MKKYYLKIGELAQAAGETIPTIRVWTKEGLLIVAERSQSGYQLYNEDMIERVKEIRKLKSKNIYTLEGIKKVLENEK